MPHAYDDNEPVARKPRGNGEATNNRRNLSEISRLFLSDLRRLNGDERQPPRRLPPGTARPDETVDITPDEFAGDDPEPTATGVSAVIVADSDGAIGRAADYAAGVGGGGTVGLIVIEPTGLRLACVTADGDEDVPAPLAVTDPARLAAALDEAKVDVPRWLIVVPEPRLPHARRLLAGLADWTLLTSADHDGVVAGYRSLKGLSDLDFPAVRPSVTLAFHGAADADLAQKSAAKLAGVCRQFLDLSVEAPDACPAAGDVYNVASVRYRELLAAEWPDARTAAAGWAALENALLPKNNPNDAMTPDPAAAEPVESPFARDRAPRGAAARPAPFIAESSIPPMARPAPKVERPAPAADAWVTPEQALAAAEACEAQARRLTDNLRVPEIARPVAAEPAPLPPKPASGLRLATEVAAAPAPAAPPIRLAGAADEVIDLGPDGDVASVVLGRLGLAATPVDVPAMPGVRLCVSREGRLTLVAAAAPGLGDLGQIGRSVAWAADNRSLLSMALAQYRLDSSADVRLHLLVGHDDAGAEALRPLLGASRVTVQTYRKLTWGGRAGVLLEAA